MKILFLDVDGVLNSAEFFCRNKHIVRPSEVDPKAVKRILRVLEATGAQIVLSSSWRHVPELIERLIQAGLPIMDKTTVLLDQPRSAEIRAWLDEHPETTSFAIIDDDTDAEIAGHFVRTRWKHGMYGKHEAMLIALLGVA